MACSRSLAICFLITLMFKLLLICLNSTKAAMGYDLLLANVFPFETITTLKDYQLIFNLLF